MARIRSVKPELHASKSLSRCSRDARWVFVGLFTLADDFGRLRDLPKQICGDLFPHEDSVTVAMVVEWLDELADQDCIRRYEVGETACIYLPNWSAHQKISKPTPSRLPEPPNDPRDSPGKPTYPQGGSSGESRESQGEREVEVEREFDLASAGAVAGESYPHPRAELAVAVMRVCGIDSKAMTDSAAASLAKAVNQLPDSAVPSEVAPRAARLRLKYPNAPVTPHSLAKHWPELSGVRQVHEPSSASRFGAALARSEPDPDRASQQCIEEFPIAEQSIEAFAEYERIRDLSGAAVG